MISKGGWSREARGDEMEEEVGITEGFGRG